MSIKVLNQNSNSRCFNDFTAEFADVKYNVKLASGVAQSVTAPYDVGLALQPNGKNAYDVLIKTSPTACVWVAKNTTAVVSGASFAACDEELIAGVTCRFVYAGDTLSFITEDTNAFVWVGFYAAR
jgi:hypothetical protein